MALPEGALFEWADYLTLKLLGRRSLYGRKANNPEAGKRNEKACFMNVLPGKNRRDISCVNCGACIDACDTELSGKGLFNCTLGERRSHAGEHRADSRVKAVLGPKTTGSSLMH